MTTSNYNFTNKNLISIKNSLLENDKKIFKFKTTKEKKQILLNLNFNQKIYLLKQLSLEEKIDLFNEFHANKTYNFLGSSFYFIDKKIPNIADFNKKQLNIILILLIFTTLSFANKVIFNNESQNNKPNLWLLTGFILTTLLYIHKTIFQNKY